MEAKGLSLRQSFTDCYPELKSVEYDEEQDRTLQLDDEFGPISLPLEDYISLPEDIKVEWVDCE